MLVVVLLGGFARQCLWCLFLNVKNKTTGDYVKSGTPLVANFFFAGLAGRHLVLAVRLPEVGRTGDGNHAYVGLAVLMCRRHPL